MATPSYYKFNQVKQKNISLSILGAAIAQGIQLLRLLINVRAQLREQDLVNRNYKCSWVYQILCNAVSAKQFESPCMKPLQEPLMPRNGV